MRRLRLESPEDVAALLQLPLAELEAVAASVHRRVRRFSREKDDGGIRPIIAAAAALEKIQESIKVHILNRLEFPDCVHAYRKGRSHVTAARAHLGCRVLLCADIQGFYPSIRQERVDAAWRFLGCKPSAARLLTRLTTCDYQLPQGFRSSNGIANLVRRDLDARIQELANRRRLTYTNFSDNLFLSGRRVPLRVAVLCREIARTYGWRLHEVTVKGPEETKIIMGLTVGDTLDVLPEYYTHVEAHIRELSNGTASAEAVLPHVRGHISYVNQVSPPGAERLRALLDSALSQAR